MKVLDIMLISFCVAVALSVIQIAIHNYRGQKNGNRK